MESGIAIIKMDDLIGLWSCSIRNGIDVGKIEAVKDEWYRLVLVKGKWRFIVHQRILRTHDDWLLTDSDGTVWEAWEDKDGHVNIAVKDLGIYAFGGWCLDTSYKTIDAIKIQICRAMGIPIQPWEVKKEWEK